MRFWRALIVLNAACLSAQTTMHLTLAEAQRQALLHNPQFSGAKLNALAAAQAAVGFEPPANVRADQVTIQGVRLPYLKFPRNPTL